jgi:hypothetical protein
MNRQSYIGVTGFTNAEDVKVVADEMVPENDRLLMVGVLASNKTFEGLVHDWFRRYPKASELGDVFIQHPRVLNLIHYNTDNQEGLARQLEHVFRLAVPFISGFQLNLKWPDPTELRTFLRKERMREQMRMVLQIGGGAMKHCAFDPALIADRVLMYKDVITDVLVDASGGTGKAFDAKVVMPILEAIEARRLDVGLGLAGGISPSTLELLEPIARQFPAINIDIERGVRDDADGGGNLIVAQAVDYVRGAQSMFENVVKMK